MDSYTIAWSIALIGVVVNVVGGIWYVGALRSIGGEIRKSQLGILAASMLWLAYSVLMIILAFKKIPLTSAVWNIIPIGYATTSVVFMTGTYNLMKVLKNLSK